MTAHQGQHPTGSKYDHLVEAEGGEGEREGEGEGKGKGKEVGGATPNFVDAPVPVDPISFDHPILEHTTTHKNQDLTRSRHSQAGVQRGGTTSSADASGTRETLLQPIYLTEGSFGKISYFPLQDNVYKTVLQGDKESAKRLSHEYEILQDIVRLIAVTGSPES